MNQMIRTYVREKTGYYVMPPPRTGIKYFFPKFFRKSDVVLTMLSKPATIDHY
jgi:hypothetical protein